MVAVSSKPDKLRNVYTIKKSTARNVTIQKRKVKIKVIAFIINFKTNKSICYRIGFVLERFKSKKGDSASVAVVFALFNCSSGGINLFDHAFKIRIVNVQKVIEVPRSRIKSLDNIS